MTITETQLSETATAQLDETGNGIAILTPEPGEKWHNVIVSVKASSAIRDAQCRIFYGTDTREINYIEGTKSGSSGDDTNRLADVMLPNSVFAVWTEGDAYATATLTVDGTKEVI